jgi:hypothetical protein
MKTDMNNRLKSIKDKLLNEFRVLHGFHIQQTEGFGPGARWLYGAIGVVSSVFVLFLFLLATLNPFWFRRSVFDLLLYTVAPSLCQARAHLFREYAMKVNAQKMKEIKGRK